MFLLFSLLGLVSKAQLVNIEKDEMIAVFEKINSFFVNTPSYSLTVTHASYEDYTTQTPVEISTGTFKKQDKNYHSFLMGMHTIQNNKYKVVVDTLNKRILVANPDQLTMMIYTADYYKQLLKNCTKIKKTTSGRYTFYKVELPAESQIGAYEFLVDEEGLAREVTWYYNTEIKKDDDDENSKVKPRVSIRFSNYKIDPVFSAEAFSEENYFKAETNKLVVTNNYSGFKLFDQRVKN